MTITVSTKEVMDFLKIVDEFDKEFIEKIIIYAQELLEKILDRKLNLLLNNNKKLPGDIKLVLFSLIAEIYDERSLEKIIQKNCAVIARYQKIYI